MAATGYHELARDQLERYRAAVLDDAGGLELGPPALKGTPRGVPRDHPRADLLRFTSMVVFGRAPDAALEGRVALDFARRVAADAAPVTGWLNARVGASRVSPGERPPRGRPRR